MAPRTRRAATQKQKLSKNEDIVVTTPPGKMKVGGILASLSNNVPAVKSGKRAVGKKDASRNEAEAIEICNESLLKTPQLPRSVLVGKDDYSCSPLTQPRIPKSTTSRDSPDKLLREEDSVVSSEVFSPLPKSRLARKPRKVIDDEGTTSSEDKEDDDDTLEMDEEDIPENDPNETILESESSDEQNESEEDVESEVDSGTDLESEREEDYEDSDDGIDSDDGEPDDDEYVPEEDEDSVSDENLDDYIEDEEESKKYSLRKRQAKAKSQKHALDAASDTGKMEQTPVKAHDNRSSKVSVGSTESLDTNEAETYDAKSIDVFEADDAAGLEQTPNKANMPNDHSTCLDSPEPEVAVILDDDDFDDDDDILVATILADEEEEIEESNEETPLSKLPVVDVRDQDTKTAENVRNDRRPFVEDDDKEDSTVESRGTHVVVESEEKTKTPSKDVESSIRSGKQNSSFAKESKTIVVSSMAGSTQDNHASQNCTPKPTRRKARKSFFRMEGVVKRGKWTLGSKIGVGSFGVVHVGMNNETGTLMAVKSFKVVDSVMEDIRREVELMRSLDHPNIVRYLGAQMDKTHLYIFQQWIPGGSVATLLGRFGPFTLQVIRSYLSQTLSGLAYLHENDIMHRDIKGSNILVTDDGIVKLADFGASKKLSNLKGNLMMSLTVRGTPYFMSPEVFEEKYSAKADIWGIGCVAYQMITGCPPWKSEGFTSPISLFNHIKKHTGPPPMDKVHNERLFNEDSTTYSRLCELLECCFDKDPASRPDASAMLEHTFFTAMHPDVDDESILSRGLFSPANGHNSPAGDSEIDETPSPLPLGLAAPTPPKSLSRSKSVVQWRTTFASPPRQKRSTTKIRQQSPISASPHYSPEPDTSMWPKWALEELEKRNLFDKSPSRKPTLMKDENDLNAMMGSLALSADSDRPSDITHREDSQGRISTIGNTEGSKLAGLSFLSETDARNTYEL